MIKPVPMDNPLTSQFSELASNNLKTNKNNDVIKDDFNPSQKVIRTELGKVSENIALKNAQEVQNIKNEKESVEEIEQAFTEISDFMSLYNRNVNFSLDEKSERTIIKVFDSDSKELIKQFPSEDLIKLAQKIRALRQDVDLKSGIFLDEKV